MWILDSGSIYHIARDQDTFVEYQSIMWETKWIYIWNSRVDVERIGTSDLRMRDGYVVVFHVVPYATQIC